MQFASLGFDEGGLFSFKEGDTLCHNPFEISMQAMTGRRILDDYSGVSGMLVSRYYPIDDLPDVTEDEYAKTAMNWLLERTRAVKDALVIDYDFNAEYAGESIKAPWHSAFGQSYFVLALLCWGRWSQEKSYYQLAEKAARGLVLDVKEGGCSIPFADGIWFEEIPYGNMTHIFNAHLMAIVALLEIQTKLHLKWTEPFIRQGIAAFSAVAHKMDSGISSVYDMPDVRSGFLQMEPTDPAVEIWLKSITITDSVNKRHLSLSDTSCFDTSESLWIAGTDWSEQDAQGYRRLLFGALLRAFPSESGTRQNSFLHLKNISNQRETFKISVEYRCERDTSMRFFRADGAGGFCGLGFMDEIALPEGEGCVSITLPVVTLAYPIHPSYHTFHITLLEEFTRLSDKQNFIWLIKKFRGYNDKVWLRAHKSQRKSPALSSVSVTVNSRCGLLCKMCDLGMENAKASIFKNLRKEHQINPDLMVARCVEAMPELRTVHFVGTEVTLYKPFPTLVKRLRDAGLEVLATTNGINLPNMLPDLLKADLNGLYISIDAPELLHDKIRGKKGLYRSILDCLEQNREAILVSKAEQGFKLRVECTILPMSYLHLPELVVSLRGTVVDGIDCTHMNFVLTQTAERHNAGGERYQIGESCTHPDMAPNKVNPYLMRSKIFEARETAAECGLEFTSVPQLQTYLEFRDFYKRPEICVCSRRCTVPDRHLQISADGTVCLMSRCFPFDIGSIYNHSLKELFYSMSMIEFREYIRKGGHEPCYHCCGIME